MQRRVDGGETLLDPEAVTVKSSWFFVLPSMIQWGGLSTEGHGRAAFQSDGLGLAPYRIAPPGTDAGILGRSER